MKGGIGEGVVTQRREIALGDLHELCVEHGTHGVTRQKPETPTP